jgi:uncharacterized protein involved in exopolysaccharide biosynthesis
LEQETTRLLQRDLVYADSIIADLRSNETSYKNQIASFTVDGKLCDQQVRTGAAEIAALKKKARRQRTATIITGVLGLLGTAAALFL